MTLKDFYVMVAQRADTAGLKINAADVSRVLSEAFKVLVRCEADAAVAIVAAGLKKAASKQY